MCVGYMKKTFARYCLCGKCLFKAIEFIVNYLPTSYSVIVDSPPNPSKVEDQYHILIITAWLERWLSG